MAVAVTLKKLAASGLPAALLFLLLVLSLSLLSGATQNSSEFSRIYVAILVINVAAALLLVALIGAQLYRLVRQYRAGTTGSRLSVRLVAVFVLLAVGPVLLVYVFSMDFLRRGIDSWFDVRLERALGDALELSRTALDERTRDMLQRTQLSARELTGQATLDQRVDIERWRERSGAEELSLQHGSTVVAYSLAGSQARLPQPIPPELLNQVRVGEPYAALDPLRNGVLRVRVVVALPDGMSWMQALYLVPGRTGALTDSVQAVYAKYQEITYMRGPLKFSFKLTLSLVLLLSLLMAVWAAFVFARRLTEPIRVLAIGTRAVAAGDYDQHLALPAARDELAFLVQSFNDMTRKIAAARDEARASQARAEQQRAYLEAVLGRLSSGVLALDVDQILRTANTVASPILGVTLADFMGLPLWQLGMAHPHLEPLVEAILPHLDGTAVEWREEVVLLGAGGRQVLMCRGAALTDTAGGAGQVVVFDDITLLIHTQREAAWGEVARRLAHEIKNPLTPIQLSAERLRHRYLKTMDPAEADVLDRATHTIIAQVDAMKEMVKAFSEYARPPKLALHPLDLNMLISEVLELYRGDESRPRISVTLDPELPLLRADAGRLRQVLHNVVKNAVEAALEGATLPGKVNVSTHYVREAGFDIAEWRVQDTGPGIAPEVAGQLFEPGVTHKAKGSGLGLAIVKKIVEEHGGVVWAENVPEGGAVFIVRLPVPPVEHPKHSKETA